MEKEVVEEEEEAITSFVEGACASNTPHLRFLDFDYRSSRAPRRRRKSSRRDALATVIARIVRQEVIPLIQGYPENTDSGDSSSCVLAWPRAARIRGGCLPEDRSPTVHVTNVWM